MCIPKGIIALKLHFSSIIFHALDIATDAVLNGQGQLPLSGRYVAKDWSPVTSTQELRVRQQRQTTDCHAITSIVLYSH